MKLLCAVEKRVVQKLRAESTSLFGCALYHLLSIYAYTTYTLKNIRIEYQ